jgi:ATP-dependent DNA helicase RecG
MDYTALRELIRGSEDGRIEYKRSTAELHGALESVCAFLNQSGGGFVIIGARNNGALVGQEVGEDTRHRIAAELAKIEPVSSVTLEFVPLPERSSKAAVFSAQPAPDLRPYTYDGRAYERIDNTTRRMSQSKYQKLLLNRIQTSTRWETGVSLSARLIDLDIEEIEETIARGVETGRIPETRFRNAGDILDRLNLRIDGKITNAALALFSKSVLPWFPQFSVRLGRFRGIDKSEFLDNRQEYGNISKVLSESLLFLRRHLPLSSRIQPGLFQREDELLFPLEALREALVNAVCHRDYSLLGGAISVAIYDDRLEIWSDGTLPTGITVESLKQEHQSRPRNPLIAGVLFKRGLVESWGRGTQKIVELCVGAGHPEPEFVEQAGSVGVKFIPKEYIAPFRVAFNLTSSQREILQLLARGLNKSLNAIASEMSDKPSKANVRSDLDQLRRLDLVDTRGHARGATWFMKTTLASSGGNKSG